MKALIRFAPLVLGLLLLSPAARAGGDAASRLQAAEDAAVRGEEARATEAYQALLEDGVDSAELRYNLGTLHLEAGELGLAVLHLRTALAQDPSLEDAAHNLEVALAARKDRVIDADLTRPLEEQVAALLSPNAAALSLLAALTLCALLTGAVPWAPAGRLRRVVASLGAAALVPTALTGVVVAAQGLVLMRKEAVVLAEEVTARVAPSVEAEASFTAHPGLYGRVLEEEAGFVRLRLDNGLDAWLPEDGLGFVGE